MHNLMHQLLLAACVATPSMTALAAGDAETGRALYQSRCTACHSLDYNGVGPAHRGVFGRGAALAPGFAAVLSWWLLREPLGGWSWVALGAMTVGALMLGTDVHEHEHTHEALEHDHGHEHDEHHQHPHTSEELARVPHAHPHRHEPITHTHAHTHDVHHRHPH